MKELTTEQKAKAYDEALERANAAHKDEDGHLKATLERIFPELKESEDERIRKVLIELVKCNERSGYKLLNNVPTSSMIAWLEKQGEQKPILDFKAKDWYVSEVDGKIHNIYHSVDKVEPKFKVGDWVAQGCNILKIRCVGDEYYCFETVGGYVDDMLVSEMDSLYRLWTIQDAKPGDVLACNEEILLFKSYSEQGRISLYCWYNGQTNNFHSKEINDTSLTTRNKICPATKEQRDTLFAKMREAEFQLPTS